MPAGGIDTEGLPLATLQHLVEHNLSLNLLDNAVFYAELLVSMQPSEVHRHLLAVALWIANRRSGAVEALRGCTAPSNRYQRASYLKALDRREEALDELLHGTGLTGLPPAKLQQRLRAGALVPGGAAGLYLAGALMQAAQRAEHAIAFYEASLALDPSMWCSFTALSRLGKEVDAAAVFAPDAASSLPQAHPLKASAPIVEVKESTTDRSSAAPLAASALGGEKAPSAVAAALSFSSGAGGAMVATPVAAAAPQRLAFESAGTMATQSMTTGSQLHGGSSMLRSALHFASPASPLPSPLTPAVRMAMAAPQSAGRAAQGTPSQADTGHSESTAPFTRPRGAARLSLESVPSAARTPEAGGLVSPGDAREGPSLAPPAVPLGRRARRVLTDRRQSLESVPEEAAGRAGGEAGAGDHTAAQVGHRSTALHMLTQLASVKQALLLHRPDQAASAAQALPAHLTTAVPVLRWRGLALAEAAQHGQAVSVLQLMRREAPWTLDGVDTLSTALWHTGATATLSALASELRGMDRLSPVTWIASGNALSAAGDHAGAASMFKRALQLDPTCAGAACLLGHEAGAQGDTAGATAAFRKALALDACSYVAWFGLGGVYYRAEEWASAAVHFARAVELFPASSVLQCYLGMAHAKLGRQHEALACLTRAVEVDDRNAQAWFQRAQLLEAAGQMEKALQALQRTEALAPREAAVHMLMGKVAKALGLLPRAVRAYNRALELAPKDANTIKRALDDVYLESEGVAVEDVV